MFKPQQTISTKPQTGWGWGGVGVGVGVWGGRYIFQNALYKGYSHPFKVICKKSAASLLKSREQRYVKAVNNSVRSVSHTLYIAHATRWLWRSSTCSCKTVPSISLQSAGSLSSTQTKSWGMSEISAKVIVHSVNDFTDYYQLTLFDEAIKHIRLLVAELFGLSILACYDTQNSINT